MKKHVSLSLFALFIALTQISVQAAQAGTANDGSFSEYQHLDPHNVVPDAALKRALIYMERNKSTFSNKNYIGVIDYTQPTNAYRFYIINMKSGDVSRYLVSNGKGSDKNRDGVAERFSNKAEAHTTSIGFMKTAEFYKGKHGTSMRLDGLSSSNSNARARAIVIHAAAYVKGGGRSWGCPAVEPSKRNEIFAKLKGGAMLYAFAGQGQ